MNTRINTFSHFNGLCDSKRIVCERRGKKISLTTPDGATTAECDSVKDAMDTVRNDPTFANLPIVISQRRPVGEKMAATKVELYKYTFSNRNNFVFKTHAESLAEALEAFNQGREPYKVVREFVGSVVIESEKGISFGVVWTT